MFTERTRKILQGFLINPQVKFEYPITAISTPTKSMIVFINMKETGEKEEDFKEKFGIIKTDVLLSLLNNITDAEVISDNSNIIIKNDKIKQKIRKSPPNIFMDIRKESIDLVENTFKVINEFELSKDIFKNILSRAKLLGHDVLVIKENKIITGRENGKELEDESETLIETSNKGEIKLNIIDILKLPIIDYKFKIYKGEVKLVIAYPKDFEEVKVVISERLN